MSDYSLPARVQPQLWINDNAVDTGASIDFDAAAPLVGLRANQFSRAAQEILADRHDYDDLAIDAGVVEDWLSKNEEGTICVTVERYDFEEWLEKVGLTAEEAVEMTDERLAELRAVVLADEKTPTRGM